MTRARPGLKREKCLMSEPVPALPHTGFSFRLVLTWSDCSSLSLFRSASSVLALKAARKFLLESVRVASLPPSLPT